MICKLLNKISNLDTFWDYINIQDHVFAGKWDQKKAIKMQHASPHIVLINRHEDGRMAVPGGGLEKSQTIIQAMNEEFKQETGLINLLDGGMIIHT